MSNLFPHKKNTLRLKLHSATLMISISLSLWLSAVMELAGVGLTFWLTWSSIGWLKVTINGFLFTLSARVEVLPWQRQSLSFSTEGLGDALEGDFPEAWRGSEDRHGGSWREWNKEKKENEKRAHISNYPFKLPSRHIDLHHNCNMNLYSACMEMKCLKGKSEFAKVAPMVWINI